jgi:hypothetical protein
VRADDAEAGPKRRALPPERLYLTEDDWTRAAAGAQGAVLEPGGHEPIPVFAERSRPRSAFLAFLDAQAEAGRRVVLTAARRPCSRS